jgi:thiamine biosynthesis lipoprotein
MDTLVSISVYTQNAAEEPRIRQAIAEAFSEMARIDSMMSSYREDSEVSVINEQTVGSEASGISAEIDTVLRAAQWAAQISDGAFDITIAPVLRLWGFGTDSVGLPSAEEITVRLPLVNYRNLVMAPENGNHWTAPQKRKVSFRQPGMAIDLGGIAKGYAVDRGLEVLRRAGVRDAMVEAGGDLRANASPRTAGRRYIWIRHPRAANAADTRVDGQDQTYFARFRLDNGAVATSGDYERFFEHNGKRYHHLLDPHTGYPASQAVSATVIANNAMLADALATALFVLGPDRAIALAEALPDVEAVIIYGDTEKLKWTATKSLKKNLEVFE